MKSLILRYAKAISAAAGSVTPAVVMTAGHEYLGWDVPMPLALMAVAVLGSVATALAPANEPLLSEDLVDQPEITPATNSDLYSDEAVEEYVGRHRAEP